jgi:hypothetical protein
MLLSLACLSACATAAVEGTPIAEWAGAYGNEEPITRNISSGDGGSPRPMYLGTVQNVLEIRPIGPKRARVDIALFYPRGHQCAVSAPADLVNDRLVVYADPDDGPCRILIRREKGASGDESLIIAVDENVSKVCYVWCGANARLSASIPVSSRHALPETPVTELE